MNETCTVSLNDILLPSGGTEGKNSPGSGVCAELPARPLGEPSLRQKSSR